MKHTLLIGGDHKRASTKIFERLIHDRVLADELLNIILDYKDVDECVLLYSHERFEIYLITKDPNKTVLNVVKLLSQLTGFSEHKIVNSFYQYRCEEAVRHFLKVLSGLESVSILSKDRPYTTNSLNKLRETGFVGEHLNVLLDIGSELLLRLERLSFKNTLADSISLAAALKAAEHTDSGTGKIGIIGCGNMGRTIAKHLMHMGAKHIYLINRTEAAAQEVASEIKGFFLPFNKNYHLLKISDTVITATSAKSHIIGKDEINNAMKSKKSLTIVDIASNPNVELPDTIDDRIKYYSLDDLKKIVSNDRNNRKIVANILEKHIESKLQLFKEWYHFEKRASSEVESETQTDSRNL